MYKGVKEIKYETIASCHLLDMNYTQGKGINYGNKVDEFLKQTLKSRQHVISRNLWIEVLANIEIHGSKECILTIGKIGENIVLEVFEENGGFDLSKLPYGIGGCGYRTMCQSKNQVSHSEDGRRTFIVSK